MRKQPVIKLLAVVVVKRVVRLLVVVGKPLVKRVEHEQKSVSEDSQSLARVLCQRTCVSSMVTNVVVNHLLASFALP